MTNTILGEKLLTFAEAAKIIPGRPHLNSLRRWADKGVDGVRLDSWRVGTKRVTSIEAIERFILARSGQSIPTQPKGATRAHLAAEAKLDAMGVK